MVDRETGCGFVLPESSLSTFFFCEEGICFVPAVANRAICGSTSGKMYLTTAYKA